MFPYTQLYTYIQAESTYLIQTHPHQSIQSQSSEELQAAVAAGTVKPETSVYVKAVNEWHLGHGTAIFVGFHMFAVCRAYPLVI